MGQKTHPIGFRLGGVQDWRAHWFASKASDYRRLTEEDQRIRGLINDRYAESGAISRVEIERGAQDLVVTINTARPGIIIGRGGTRVDELRGDLEKLTEKRSRLNIQEIRQPELDATLVGQSIAEQLERRVAYRRAVRLAMQRTMQSGALGIKVVVSGRLGGAEIARTDKQKEGRTPLHTLRAQIDFAVSEAKTTFGVIGIKVWIYTGDMIPSAENLRARAQSRLSLGASQEGQGAQGGQGGQSGSGGQGKSSGGGRSKSGGGSSQGKSGGGRSEG
jgi:small subunit ribosomal protein S3